MSNSTYSTLTFASQQVTIYTGFFLFITGLIGGLLVLMVFLSLQTFRQSSCAFYLTIMSTVNTCHLFTGLLTYIMINGFGINWTDMSLFYCKFRPFYVQFCVLMSLTCMCLATIDQFLATCSNPRWHQWNNIKIAHSIIIGVVIVWMLHGIPFLNYYNHVTSLVTSQPSCVIINTIFQKYFTFFHIPALVTFIPIIVMTIFGLLAYRNVQKIAYRAVPLVRRELDKQLTAMVLVQVFYNAITILPITMQTIYNIIFGTPSDSFSLVKFNFIRNLTNICFYFYFVGSFYIYICVSKRFRQQLVHVLFTFYPNQWCNRELINNRIEPQT